MRCNFYKTDILHKSGRCQLACSRLGCTVIGLMPPNGMPSDLQAECNGWPHWYEFGEMVALLLAVIGLDKRTWLWIKGRLGMAQVCGCNQRIEAANSIGSRFAVWLGFKQPSPPPPTAESPAQLV